MVGEHDPIINVAAADWPWRETGIVSGLQDFNAPRPNGGAEKPLTWTHCRCQITACARVLNVSLRCPPSP